MLFVSTFCLTSDCKSAVLWPQGSETWPVAVVWQDLVFWSRYLSFTISMSITRYDCWSLDSQKLMFFYLEMETEFLVSVTTNYSCLLLICTDASTTKLLGTWWTTAHQYPTLPVVNGYVLPVVIKSLSHGTGSVPTDVGYLPLLAQLSGTLPADMRDPDVSEDSYRQSLKTFLFAQY